MPNRFGGIGYLGFEKLTFVPIQVKLKIIIFVYDFMMLFLLTASYCTLLMDGLVCTLWFRLSLVQVSPKVY